MSKKKADQYTDNYEHGEIEKSCETCKHLLGEIKKEPCVSCSYIN